MATLDMRDFHSLEEIRGCLFFYVQHYNHPPIPPSMAGPRRTVSFPNRNRSGAYPGRHWNRPSFWRRNAGSPRTRSSSSTRWNTRWTVASPGSASACAIPRICGKSTLWKRTEPLLWYACSTNRKTPSSNRIKYVYAKEISD